MIQRATFFLPSVFNQRNAFIQKMHNSISIYLAFVQDYGCSPPPVTPAVKQAAQTYVPASVFSSAAADSALAWTS